MSLEFDRIANRITRLVMPLLDPASRPDYYTGALAGPTIDCYKFSDSDSPSLHTITPVTITQLGATGLWEVHLTADQTNLGTWTDMVLKIDDDNIDEQTALVRIKQRLSQIELTSANGSALDINQSGAFSAIDILSAGADAIAVDGGSYTAIALVSTSGLNTVPVVDITGSACGIRVLPSGGNFIGMDINGAGTNPAIDIDGGATGHAVDIAGGSTSGRGVNISTTNGHGVAVLSLGGKNGIDIDATNYGKGIYINAYTDGIGIGCNNDGIDISVSNGDGIAINSNSGAGVDINGGTDGITIDASGGEGIAINATSIGVNVTSSASIGVKVMSNDASSTGVTIDGGIYCASSYRSALSLATGSSTSDPTLKIATHPASGLDAVGITANGNGINIASDGNGINVATTDGHGINIDVDGAGMNGVNIDSDDAIGMKVVGEGTGVNYDIDAPNSDLGLSVDLSTITASLSTITVNLGTPVDLGDGATIADNMTSLGGKTANAGTYDRTTDSQEAIRDQGDADWSATADLSTITASLATITANIGTPADLGSGADLANNLFDIDALNDSIIDGSALSIVTITNDVASLVAGTAPVSDGITQAMLIEIASAMVNGKYALNTPGAGDITFYERDNVTPLTVVNVTASGRTRTSP